MTEQEANALIAEGAGIDAGAAAHADAAATGNLDAKGNIMPAPDPNAELQAKAQNWFMVPKALAWAITAVFPETEPYYTDDKCMELAQAIVPVAEKYGLNGFQESPELMLVMGTAFFCAPGYGAYKTRRAVAEIVEQAKAKGEDPKAAVAEFMAKREALMNGAIEAMNGSRE
jgi:hypothetical protein